MEDLIDSILKGKVHDHKKTYYSKHKEEYIEKVISTIYAISNLVDFDSLISLVYGIFTYHYTKIEGSNYYGTTRVHPSLDQSKIFKLDWFVDSRLHKYIALINENARILTYDSFNATKFNKAGILGVIQGKNLLKLENYIRDHCDGKVLMWSSPVISDSKELERIQEMTRKYKIKGPLYEMIYNYDFDKEDYVFEDGYRDGYSMNINNLISHDIIVNTFCEFDSEILKKGKISLTSTRKELLRSLKSEDLYKLSFLGTKLNDNSIFRLLSEFNP